MPSRKSFAIDTNVLLVIIPSTSPFHHLFQKLLDNRFDIFVSNEIVTEYQEKISERYGLKYSDASIDFILLLSNVKLSRPYYKWQLIDMDDDDDNKFVDCYIASSANYLVTNDKHFNVLRKVGFPIVNLISLKEFEKILAEDSET